MRRAILLLAAVALAVPAAAQNAQPAAHQPGAPAADAAVSATRSLWQIMGGYMDRAAEQMSEEDFAYRPVETVRTFGQMLAHVAGAQYMFCAAALGDAARGEDDIERTATTKAEILQAFRDSNEYCARAYALTDAAGSEQIQLFGQPRTRFFALTMNAVHVGEHYGNMVTYMRMKGMVPPSSQPRQ